MQSNLAAPVAVSLRPLPAFLAAQGAGAVLVVALLMVAGEGPGAGQMHAAALVQGVLAVRVALVLGAAAWWLPIHAAFVPGALAMSSLELPPGVFLAGFALLALVYWSSFSSQVPLYLSSHRVAGVLAELVPGVPAPRFVDLGCGLGGPLARLSALRPDVACEGVELAPLPWFASRLRAAFCRNRFRVDRRSLWDSDLRTSSLVYAYLSPVPMAALWDKVSREMRPGTLFVSNSFRVPGVEADRVIPVGDWQHTQLYVYTVR